MAKANLHGCHLNRVNRVSFSKEVSLMVKLEEGKVAITSMTIKI